MAIGQFASVVEEVFSSNPFPEMIPDLHVDDTIRDDLESFFKSTGSSDDKEDAVVPSETLFAILESSRTRSVKEAAFRAKARHVWYRIDHGF
jgi:hypothetical protein